MSKVDWSLAPDDATHFGRGQDCGYWVKIDKGVQYFINISSWDNGKWKQSPEPDKLSLLIARPIKPWSGPEDGLPPVGSEVELGCDCIMARFDDFKLFEKGTRVLVGGHANFGGVDVAVIHREHDSQGYTATLCQYLEPIRTPQQLAAEHRETAIRELMDIAQVDCRVTAARLVDAGFKREVV